MLTAMIARLTQTYPPRFEGRFYSGESSPTSLGKTLWELYHQRFDRDLGALLRTLIDEPSLAEGRLERDDLSHHDLSRLSVFDAGAASDPGNPEGASPNLPERGQQDAATADCEWTYAFLAADRPEHDVLFVLRRFVPVAPQLARRAVPSRPFSPCRIAALVALADEEPDWERLEGVHYGPSRSLCTTIYLHVSYDDRENEEAMGVYEVATLYGSSYYVSMRRDQAGRRFYCSCSSGLPAPTDCEHVRTLQGHLEDLLQVAAWRRGRDVQNEGVRYSGQRFPSGEVCVLAWEDGEPRLLDPRPIQKLLLEPRCGFDWRNEARNGPSDNGQSGNEQTAALTRSRTRQLALALLRDFTGDEELALRLHLDFLDRAFGALADSETKGSLTSWYLRGEVIQRFLDEFGTGL